MKKIKINDANWASIQMHLADMLIEKTADDERLFHKFEIPKTIYHYTSLSGLIAIN